MLLATELLVRIETGQKQQIRKHLSMAGKPVVGDRLYAGARAVKGDDLQLPAARLALKIPAIAVLEELNIIQLQ
ncbi:MAG: hypothetical protein WBN40_00275 [Pseudomonadales bacterium]